jgi:hypothetical protein
MSGWEGEESGRREVSGRANPYPDEDGIRLIQIIQSWRITHVELRRRGERTMGGIRASKHLSRGRHQIQIVPSWRMTRQAEQEMRADEGRYQGEQTQIQSMYCIHVHPRGLR